MPITSGSRLGSYEVIEPLGRGGMGEVYRAHDARLRRDVALKVIHPHLLDSAHDERFRREARALATLSHPNVASVYELGEAEGTSFIAMELVTGETLADRLVHGPLPTPEVIRIARQVAAALEAVHDKGIVHRDLKPANIKLTPGGVVKVLDFGLAKNLRTDVRADLPTETLATREGVIVGTAAYMSPEQMRGQDVDRRTDVWSFGCVVYEMFTGRLAFGASTSADTIAAVIERDADWSALPRDVPPSIARLLRRCLRRDPTTRLRDMGDARLELDEASPADETTRVTDGRRRIPVIAIAGLLAAGAVLGALATAARRAPVPDNATPAHFMISLPQSAPLGGVDFPSLAMAPDGTRLVYVANRGDQTQLFVRSTDAVDPIPMAGTTNAVSPFFSPDGRWIAFFADGQLKKAALAGGAPVTLCPAPVGLGGSWSRDDVIVFAAATGSGLSQIPASGGTPRPLTTLNAAQGEFSHRWPEWLPDGETVLYTVGTSGSWNDAQIAAFSVRTGQRTMLVRGGTNAHYVAPGALIYGQRGRIMSVSFDQRHVTTTGEPSVVLENVLQSSDGAVQLSASRSGSAVFVGGASDESQRRLVAVGRDGTSAPFAAPPGPYASPRSSPDGRRLVVTLEAPNPDLWVYDVMTGTSTQVTFGSGATSPVWSPDAQQLAFSSTRAAVPNLFVTSVSRSGPIERLAASENLQSPGSWAPDGTLAYVERRVKTGRDILFVGARDRTPRAFLDSTADESAPAFSPDGRWLAYVSTESGRNEVYVKSLTRPDRPRRVSPDGGSEPVWSRDGRDLFYREGTKMMRVASTEQAVRPQVLFDGDFVRGTIDSPNYDVMPDGRFVMVQRPMQNAGLDMLHVLLNWNRALGAESAR